MRVRSPACRAATEHPVSRTLYNVIVYVVRITRLMYARTVRASRPAVCFLARARAVTATPRRPARYRRKRSRRRRRRGGRGQPPNVSVRHRRRSRAHNINTVVHLYALAYRTLLENIYLFQKVHLYFMCIPTRERTTNVRQQCVESFTR